MINEIEYKTDIESGNVGVYIDGLRKRTASVQELLLELINSQEVLK